MLGEKKRSDGLEKRRRVKGLDDLEMRDCGQGVVYWHELFWNASSYGWWQNPRFVIMVEYGSGGVCLVIKGGKKFEKSECWMDIYVVMKSPRIMAGFVIHNSCCVVFSKSGGVSGRLVNDNTVKYFKPQELRENFVCLLFTRGWRNNGLEVTIETRRTLLLWTWGMKGMQIFKNKIETSIWKQRKWAIRVIQVSFEERGWRDHSEVETTK